jgi:addiction module HigA family antidote
MGTHRPRRTGPGRGISPEMAIRLSKAFGSAPETWANLQLDYDMAQAMKIADQIKVRKVPLTPKI